jgi:hypothetical protein
MLKIQHSGNAMRLASTLAAAATLVVRALSAQAAPGDPPVVQPTRYELDLRVDPAGETLAGRARITVANRSARPAPEISILLYRLMRATRVAAVGGERLTVTQDVVEFEDAPALQVRRVLVRLATPLRPGGQVTLDVDYAGRLLGYAETGMLYVQDRIDTAFTLIREDAQAYPTVRWPSVRVSRAAGLPAFDYVARITVPEGYTVANVGALTDTTRRAGWTTFTYRNLQPAWRMDFAIGRLGRVDEGALHVFHIAADSLGARRLIGAMARTLALYARWFGPRRDAGSFTVIELPDGWGSQADVTGILQTAPAFRDPAHDGELYHELSHLWNVKSTDAASPRWEEGLATFLPWVTADSLGGGATTDSLATRTLARVRRRLTTEPRLATTPMIGYGSARMTDQSYVVGGLMCYVLYRVMGHEAFTHTMAELHRDHATTGARTDDLVAIATRLSPRDVQPVFRDWLYTTGWSRLAAAAERADDLVRVYDGK